MRIHRLFYIMWVASVVSLSSCVKDDLYNTPHPDKGAVEVTTDWTGRSSDAVVPADYILRIGGEEQTVQGETNAFKSLFLPGTQSLLAYHQTEGVTISGTTATVNTLEDGTLNPMPGFLFSASKELDIQKDDTLKVVVPMMQRIRTLTLGLNLKPGEELRIGTAAATLTGMASSIDLTTGTVQTTGGKTVVPAFAIGTNDGRTRAAGNPVLAATVRLLGVVSGEKQVLTLVITLVDGYVQTISTDLTELLKNFGHAEMEPLELDATLELPVASGVGGTISGWNVVDNGDIKVN
ncbi:hypothetical protein GPL10_00995 [Bacteroides fragilis]|uniref:FimB/Mfa2 family fimbrial subunit n=1 Tax=Bacteroides fragilis TaxID=817 RepID=UPI001C03965D|nr:FimB/Mfa2 family fimbrial subunit [Bacteroides fragilis]MBT9904385.1 hypothetical protein [Bacteroides fragilis]